MTNQPESNDTHAEETPVESLPEGETLGELLPEETESPDDIEVVLDPDVSLASSSDTETDRKTVPGFATLLLEPERVPSRDHMTAEAAIAWSLENGCIWNHEDQTLYHPNAGVHVQGEPFVLAVGRLLRHAAQSSHAEE